MFKNAQTNLNKPTPAPAKAVVVLPTPNVVKAGYDNPTLYACQVAVTWRNRPNGAHDAVSLGKPFHRMDVTRMVEYAVWNDEAEQYEVTLKDNDYAVLKTRLGRESEDRMLRPDIRHTMAMPQRGPYGLPNLKPWFAMFKEVQLAIAWCRKQVTIERGSGNQYALLLVVSVSDWTHKTSEWGPYYDANVVGITDLQVVQLAPEPSVELPDGFPEIEGTFNDPERGDPVDHLEVPPSEAELAGIMKSVRSVSSGVTPYVEE